MLRLLPISAHEQLANFLTKPLAPPKFNQFISKLGMINIYHGQACGRLLKHNTNKIEALLLEDKQQEHNAP